uniref:Uncharacterized protein n=1 Tax=Oryza glumipatula TaxID=40148 RepID=A0A0D9YV82_9ORYZ
MVELEDGRSATLDPVTCDDDSGQRQRSSRMVDLAPPALGRSGSAGPGPRPSLTAAAVTTAVVHYSEDDDTFNFETYH